MGRIETSQRRESGPRGLNERIAALAARQHGLVTRAQLLALGLSPSAVSRRLAAGLLHAVHRGVYTVGHPLLTRRGSDLAAVLVCGPGAVLSNQPSGALLGLVSWNGRPHVTTARSRGPLEGVVVHRTRGLHPSEVTTHDGVPCTTWARTLLDLAGELPVARVVRALEAAVVADLYHHPELLAVLARAHGHRGAGRLREVTALGHHLTPDRTRSPLEEEFLLLVREARARIPQPRMNAWLVLDDAPGYEIDALWAHARLAVELDSVKYHAHEGARRRDRARDAHLQRHGYTVLRLTWDDVTRRPGATLRRLEREVGRIETAQRRKPGPDPPGE